jgi:hypothetical protein
MFEPVLIEKGDLICIDVVTNTLWIEKKRDVQADHPAPAPKPPDLERGEMKPHMPTGKMFTGVKNASSWQAAYVLAYSVAWVAGFRVGDDTDLWLDNRNVYVFKV